MGYLQEHIIQPWQWREPGHACWCTVERFGSIMSPECECALQAVGGSRLCYSHSVLHTWICFLVAIGWVSLPSLTDAGTAGLFVVKVRRLWRSLHLPKTGRNAEVGDLETVAMQASGASCQKAMGTCRVAWMFCCCQLVPSRVGNEAS